MRDFIITMLRASACVMEDIIRIPKILTSTAVAALFVSASACATTSEMHMDTDQAFIRVENDTPELYVTVSIEDLEGHVVPLGQVERNDTERFIFEVPADIEDYRLVAVSPGDMTRSDHVVSDVFIADGGMTVNWFLDENVLEIS